MNKSLNVLLSSLLLAAGFAHSQSSESQSTTQGEVRESTDPARAAEVEQRAKDISSGQSSTQSGASSSEQNMDKSKKMPKSKNQQKSEASSGASDSSGTSGAGTSTDSGTDSSTSTPYEAGPGSSSSDSNAMPAPLNDTPGTSRLPSQ